MGRIAKDTPIADITLRKYEPASAFKGRELVRRLLLSLGLLQPGDSRDVIVDVFQVMLEEGKPMDSKEIEKRVIENRKKHGLALSGVAPSNIRRQLLRLRDLFLIEKRGNCYGLHPDPLSCVFHEKIESYYLESILKRVREYLIRIEKEFQGKENGE